MIAWPDLKGAPRRNPAVAYELNRQFKNFDTEQASVYRERDIRELYFTASPAQTRFAGQ